MRYVVSAASVLGFLGVAVVMASGLSEPAGTTMTPSMAYNIRGGWVNTKLNHLCVADSSCYTPPPSNLCKDNDGPLPGPCGRAEEYEVQAPYNEGWQWGVCAAIENESCNEEDLPTQRTCVGEYSCYWSPGSGFCVTNFSIMGSYRSQYICN